MQKIDKRVGELEERVSTAEDHIVQLQKAEKKFTQAIAELAAKNEDLENRSRRNNIRIVGIPEKAEGRNPTEYIENWLLETFGDMALTKVFAVERAHRVPPKPPVPGANPRTMLAKILNYRDGDIILRKARDMTDLTVEGQRIAIYPDYSALVQKQRMMFTVSADTRKISDIADTDIRYQYKSMGHQVSEEPLAAKIRQSDGVPGFRYWKIEEKIALYADDVLLFLADPDDSLRGAIEIVERFGTVSGLTIGVALCFSPVGNKLRVRSRKFPAVVNCTAINWFHEWPQEALESVSLRFLQETENIEAPVKDSISKFMAYVHTSVNEMSKSYLGNERRYNYTTPKSFLEQIKLYQNLLSKKRKELAAKMERLENGLEKLNSTSAQVDDLKAKLAAQEVELKQKNEDADKLIQVVGVETEKVGKEKAMADEEEKKVAIIAEEVGKKQRDCETDLAKAEPALVAAQEALNTLNKNNLTELKSFGSPPSAVTNVTAAVMVLTAPGGRVPKDRSWKAARVVMSKVDGFLDSLINFNKENIHENCIKAIQPYLKDTEFNPEFITSKSLAAAGLCSWVINIVKFYEVFCEVEPKRQALNKANAELAAAEEKLSTIKAKIALLNENLAKLTAKFEKATADKLKCQQEADATALTISLANRLISPRCYLKKEKKTLYYTHPGAFPAAGQVGWASPVRCGASYLHYKTSSSDLQPRLRRRRTLLCPVEGRQSNIGGLSTALQNAADKPLMPVGGLASENVRWAEAVRNFKLQESTLCGDVLVITAFVSYLGYFTKKYRQDLMDKTWKPYLGQLKVPIPVTESLDPLTMLTDDADIAAWQNEGLPADRMSTENATILTSCERWPLMVDPQLQGIKWIKNKYGEELRVVRIGQRGYLDTLERALAGGDVVLIENLEESVDPVLGPLLGRETIKKGRCIKIGDKECEYSPNFRLILHTKLANPHYQPEMQAQCTLINFTVTRDGLEDQLLAAVVSMERPDLEELKSNLTKQQNGFKITLKTLEDNLLSRLSSASGNFLGDVELVENLEITKKTAAEIEEKAKDIGELFVYFYLQVQEAKVTEVKLNEAREHYRPAAARASLLYFIMNDLNKIHPMYQFSLKAFSVVFQQAVQKAPTDEVLKQRVTNLIDSITFSVFQYTTRGLFECDKLTYTAQLAFQILLMNKEINSAELDFLLRYPAQPGLSSPVDFLSNQSWGGIKVGATLMWRGPLMYCTYIHRMSPAVHTYRHRASPAVHTYRHRTSTAVHTYRHRASPAVHTYRHRTSTAVHTYRHSTSPCTYIPTQDVPRCTYIPTQDVPHCTYIPTQDDPRCTLYIHTDTGHPLLYIHNDTGSPPLYIHTDTGSPPVYIHTDTGRPPLYILT
ncbi:unnamed protein product [Ranitomeya imitator]|uniref:Dynein heavy chain n=1 Tax=Ranitomeya imitator TaxID=111125 RepID=A0ABN9KY72_9NEOB|nr:unnamed protein product [Ranitomeya imitator]